MKLKELKPYLRDFNISIIDICSPSKRFLFRWNGKNGKEFSYNEDNLGYCQSDMYDVFGERAIVKTEDKIVFIL